MATKKKECELCGQLSVLEISPNTFIGARLCPDCELRAVRFPHTIAPELQERLQELRERK